MFIVQSTQQKINVVIKQVQWRLLIITLLSTCNNFDSRLTLEAYRKKAMNATCIQNHTNRDINVIILSKKIA